MMYEKFTAALEKVAYKETSNNHVNLIQNDDMTSGLAPLPFYTVVSVSGADAGTFLQNQFSNDIKQLSDTTSQLSSYSSAKGMMYGNFRVLKQGDNYLLRLSTDTTETILKRLSMFKLRDDVSLTPSDKVVLGVAGQNSDTLLKSLGLNAPSETDEVTQQNNIFVVRCVHRKECPRYEIYAPMDKAIELIKKAEYTGVPLMGSEAYLAQQIQDGEAIITEPTYEQFVAQMLNLELINGVSFKKGCYPGQEYIARTQYRGQVRSRTYVVSTNKQNVLTAGQDMFAEGTTLSIGKILNAAKLGDDYIALALLRIKHFENSVLFTKYTNTQCRINKLNLPYSLTSKE